MENCFGQPTNLLLPVRTTYSSFQECKARSIHLKTCMCYCGDARLVTSREAKIQDVLRILNQCEAVSLDSEQHNSHDLNLPQSVVTVEKHIGIISFLSSVDTRTLVCREARPITPFACLLDECEAIFEDRAAQQPFCRYAIDLAGEAHTGMLVVMPVAADSHVFVCREANICDALLFSDKCEAISEERERHGRHHDNLLLTWQQKWTGMLVVMPIAADSHCFVCREAKIHDALLFFDECEAIFEDREKHGSHHVNLLLTEVEKHDGIIIMATNRCFFLPASSVLLTA